MTQRIALYGSTALMVAITGAAHADVTAQQVWDNMTGFYGAVGYEFETGSVDSSGGTVTVTDLTVSFPNPYANMQDELSVDVSASIPMMVLEDAGDGTVNVVSSDVYTIEVVITPDGDDSGLVGLTIDQTGMQVTASGEPDMVTYDVVAPLVSASLDIIEVPGEENIADAFDVSLTMSDLSGSYTVGGSDSPNLALALAAATAGMSIAGAEPGGPGRLEANFAFESISWDTITNFASGGTPGELASMLKAGMTSNSTLAHGGSSYSVDFQDGSDAFAMNGSATSGATLTQMSDAGMTYRVSNTGMQLVMSGSEIPLPEIALDAGATAFGMTMPVLASDTAQDVGVTLRLEGLSVSDMIWGMLDPGAQLPRDPATIILELAGKGNLAFDLIDPEGMMNMPAGLPGGIEALDLNELEVTIAGASLTGNGAFTFDMSDLATFDGIPAPTGALDVSLTGANGLMDKLTAMGLLPQEQAMGARMMMGLFARPGDGEDSLVSTLEVDGASGAVSANGQRLR